MPSTIESPLHNAVQPIPQEGYSSLFQNKAFLALWLGQVFSQLADRIIFVIFISLIVNHFGHQGSLKSFLYVAFTIPAILLTALAGVFVDRWHRGRTLIATNLLRAAIVALIPLAIQFNSLLALYCCAFAISVITQFFVPAESATIPMVTRPSQLLVANSLFTTTMMASVIFGFALGDPLIALFGIHEVHWAIIGLFLLSAISLCFVRAGRPPAALEGNKLQSVFLEMKEGFAHLKQDRKLLARILKQALLFSYIVAMSIVFVSLAEAFLYRSPVIAAQKFAWIITFSGFGMVIGALSVGRLLREAPRGRLVYMGFALVGLTLLGMMMTPLFSIHPVAPSVFPYLDTRILYAHAMALLMGVGAALVAVPLQSVLHEMIPDEKRGKITGIQFTILSTASTLPAMFAGFGVDWLGVNPMLFLLGFPLFLLGLVGLYRHSQSGSHLNVAGW
jgi:MFS family permease